MKISERTLFDDDTAFNDKKISWNGTTGWHYVEAKNNPFQVIYADEKGRYFFGQRNFPRTIPIIWNNRSTAQILANRLDGRVKVYPYLLK